MIHILLNSYQLDSDWCYPILINKIKPRSKVAILAFSFSDSDIGNAEEWNRCYQKGVGGYYKYVVTPLLSYGIEEEDIVWVNYFLDTKEEAKRKLRNSDIIYLTGGLPDRMMERIEDFDLRILLEEYCGTLIGCSAGAMIQLEEYHITPDDDYEVFSYEKGLKLLQDFDIEVHFTGSVQQEDCIKKTIDEKKRKVYALEEDGGLLIENNTITTFGKVSIYRALKTKTLNRIDWHRVLHKEFTSMTLHSDVFSGEIGLIKVLGIRSPLIVKAGEEFINVADKGYYWLQFAPKGKNYWLTAMMNDEGRIVQYYFDVTFKNLIREDSTSFFYDLYLDVVVLPNGKVYIIDGEELQEAYENGIIDKADYDLAVKTANEIKNKLEGKVNDLETFCMTYYRQLKYRLE